MKTNNTIRKAFATIRKQGDGFTVRIGGPINGRVMHLKSRQDAKRRVYKHVRTIRIARLAA